MASNMAVPQIDRRFIDYVYKFYGDGGLYPMGATMDQITQATEELLSVSDNVEFDSFDRERVRDILIRKFGLVFPESKNIQHLDSKAKKVLNTLLMPSSKK